MQYVTRLLGVGGLCVLLAGCLTEGAVEDQTTFADFGPVESLDPGTYVCNPFEDDPIVGGRTHGLQGELFYLDSSMPQYEHVQDYIDNGLKLQDITLFFNQLFVP